MGRIVTPYNYQKKILNRKPITVVFCIPGQIFSIRFVQCYTNLLLTCSPKYKLNICARLLYAPNIYTVRNRLLLNTDMVLSSDIESMKTPFDGEIDYDYIMWIDSDMVFAPWQFKRLLDHDRAIVSGLSYSAPDMYNCGPDFDKDYLVEHGHFRRYNTKFFADKKDLVEVGWIGFAFILIRKGGFEELSFPWFKPDWYEVDDKRRIYLSEDVSFCREVTAKGYKIYVDPTVEVGHEKLGLMGGRFEESG